MEIDSFLIYLKSVKRYSNHTLLAYEEDLKQFSEFCEKIELIHDCSEVTAKMVRRFEVGLMSGRLVLGGSKLQPMAARSVRRKLSSLKSYFRFQMKEGKMTVNPADGVVAPKLGRKLPVFVPDYKMDELLDDHGLEGGFPECRDRLVLLMSYCTGMRRSELVGLKVDDVDVDTRMVKVNGKGGKQRMVPMLEELAEDARVYLSMRDEVVRGKHSFFFITDKGAPVYDKFVYRLVVRYLGEVTSMQKRSPHVLRHSFATALLNNGACIEAIRELLGHSSLAATQVYTHNSFESLKKVFNQAHPRA